MSILANSNEESLDDSSDLDMPPLEPISLNEATSRPKSPLTPCPSCGTAIGHPHKKGCDIERCTACQGQRIQCPCDNHEPMKAAWTGFFPLRKNLALSEALAKDKRVRARKMQCYKNAMNVVNYCPEFSAATYVEGIVIVKPFIEFEHVLLEVEHGWLEIENQIVDPTITVSDIAYFPGLRFEGIAQLSKAFQIPKDKGTKDLPIFCRFGWGGWDSDDFRRAKQFADEFFRVQNTLRQTTSELKKIKSMV